MKAKIETALNYLRIYTTATYAASIFTVVFYIYFDAQVPVAIEALSSIVKSILPIHEWAKNASNRQVSETYYAIAWLGFPGYLALSISYMNNLQDGLFGKKNLTFKEQLTLVFIMAPLFGSMAILGFVYFSGGNVRFLMLGNSLFHLAFTGVIHPISVAVLMAMSVVAIKKAFA